MVELYPNKKNNWEKKLEFYLMTLLRLLDAGVWLEDIKIVPGSSIQNQDNYHHAEAVK